MTEKTTNLGPFGIWKVWTLLQLEFIPFPGLRKAWSSILGRNKVSRKQSQILNSYKNLYCCEQLLKRLLNPSIHQHIRPGLYFFKNKNYHFDHFNGVRFFYMVCSHSTRWLLYILTSVWVLHTPNAKKLKKHKKVTNLQQNLAKKGFFKFAPKRWSNVIDPTLSAIF